MNDLANRFMKACGEGDIEYVLKNISNTELLDAESLGGATPLYHACRGDNIEVAKILLKAGAKPNKRISIVSRIDERVLCENAVAVFFAKSEKMIDLFACYKADFTIRDSQGLGIEDWLLKSGNSSLASYFKCSSQNLI